jgi:uncharacterized protein
MANKTTAEKLATIQQGYTLEGATIELGAAIVDGELHKEAQVRLPLSMMNRHGWWPAPPARVRPSRCT